MKITFLIDDFPPDKITSSGLLTLNLAQKMIKRGHQVFIITTVQDKKLEGQAEYSGLTVYKLYSKYNERWRAYLSLRNFQVIWKLKKILSELKPDVCHFQHIHYYISYHSFKIAKKFSKAVFLTTHDAMLINYGKMFPQGNNCIYKLKFWERFKEVKKRFNPFRELIIRHYLNYVDKIFCVSNLLKEILKINGIKNITTVYNSLDVSDWQVSIKEVENFIAKYNLENKKIIFFGGRLSGAKGGEVIVKAMALVVKEIPEAVLFVAGSNDNYVKKMEDLAQGLNIKDKMLITGWLDRIAIKQAFYASNVCVTPSLCCDFFNLFNIEAGAAKKPVVGTCFGGTPEVVIDGKTGYIVDPNNYHLMAEKIIDLLKNPQKAREFGEAGYQRVKEKFSDEIQVDGTLEWYKKFSG